jgi:2-oxoglutarate dehydrogenase E2 component (dihydrolipoamide succinyltransferase)
MRNIVVPELGESVVEARVARWLKKEGDSVRIGEPVVELETEKIDLEVNADTGGVIASIKRQEGEDVKIGELLAVVDETATAPSAGNGSSTAPTKASPPPPEPSPAPVEGTTSAKGATGATSATSGKGATGARGAGATGATGATRATDASATRATGARGAGDRSERRERMSKRRETIARRLVEAQHNAAMLTTFNEVDMTAIMQLRERRKEAFKKEFGVGLGIASFFVKASIAALRSFPQLNAEIQGNEIVYKNYFDIGMAVGAEGGLVVPVIRDADRLSFSRLELAIRDYAQRAADGSLTLEDLKGGTFTITNGGVFGSLLSTPILNPPQVAILGLHKIQDRVVPLNGQAAIRPMMYVALSYDHRIVDGREAVQFLVRIKEFIEDPGHLLLES